MSAEAELHEKLDKIIQLLTEIAAALAALREG